VQGGRRDPVQDKNVAGRVRHRRARICFGRGLERSTHRDSQARNLGNADDFNSEQIGLIDDVLAHLIRQIETTALAELGEKLAPVDNAPNGVIRTLARHDEIAVAGPVLAQSVQLTERDLVEIAGSKGQSHLGAISERTRLAAAVTDILIQRSDTGVVRKLSQNQGATFSDRGYVTLARRAQTDERLAENLSVRMDMPPQLLQDLLAKATETVRARLQTVVSPDPSGCDPEYSFLGVR
jgi:uncharacterized protein (DUF2336 family)